MKKTGAVGRRSVERVRSAVEGVRPDGGDELRPRLLGEGEHAAGAVLGVPDRDEAAVDAGSHLYTVTLGAAAGALPPAVEGRHGSLPQVGQHLVRRQCYVAEPVG